MSEFNPYTPPCENSQPQESEAERIRRQHVQQEACARGLGLVLFGIALACAGAVALATSGSPPPGTGGRTFTWWDAIAPLAAGLFALGTGIGLRRLKHGARLALVPLSAVLLALFPVGTGIATWIFRRFLSKKTSILFSEEYQEVMRQTPGISSGLCWVDVVVLTLTLLFGGALPFMYVDRMM